MKVFIVGATGRVGRTLTQALNDRGHFVYAGTRNIDAITASELVKPIAFDLSQDVEQISQAFDDAQAVYFVAGSRGNDLLQTDLYGAVKVMQATEKKGIKRYIHLSSVFALEPERWNESALQKITNYNIAKFFSDSWLIDNTNLDYTILQPGPLQEVKGSGKITVDISKPTPNSIENVAEVLASLLEAPNTIKKVIKMGDGDNPIPDAIAGV